MRHETQGLEYFCKRRVPNFEAAGKGTERRHYRALAVAGKASPLHRSATGAHPRLRMQMAGDLAGCTGRLMTKRDSADRNFACDHAAEIGRKRGIALARNPDPFAEQLE